MRWRGLSERAFRGALATLVLNVAQLSIYISACACVVFVWPHCLRALNRLSQSDLSRARYRIHLWNVRVQSETGSICEIYECSRGNEARTSLAVNGAWWPVDSC